MGTLKGFALPFGPTRPPPPRSLPPAGTSGPAPSPPPPLAALAPSRSASPPLPRWCAAGEGAREARGAGRVAGRPEVPAGGRAGGLPTRVHLGTLGGFAPPFGPPPASSSPLASLGLAKPSRALAPAGKARLRLRDHGNPGRVRFALRPPTRHLLPARFARPRQTLPRWCAAGDEGARGARGAGRVGGRSRSPRRGSRRAPHAIRESRAALAACA